MAAVDKIYGTRAQALELRKWLYENRRRIWVNGEKIRPFDCLYPIEYFDNKPEEYITCISNFPCKVDKFIYENCPLDWVRKAIEEQYNNNFPWSK